jgi:ABC-type bacteriocin/lantibiotic exporter with double-glycine peptidase domain
MLTRMPLQASQKRVRQPTTTFGSVIWSQLYAKHRKTGKDSLQRIMRPTTSRMSNSHTLLRQIIASSKAFPYLYAQLLYIQPAVLTGLKIKPGQFVAFVGASGRSP